MPLQPIIRFGGDEDTESLRASVRDWLAHNLPDEFRRTAANPDYLPRDAHERAVVFCKALHEQGWFVPHWPAQHEGGGRGVVEQVVIREELEQRHTDLMAYEAINRKLAAHIGKYDGLFTRLGSPTAIPAVGFAVCA